MNHYFTKSWQEFQAKRTRATTSTHSFELPEVPFDIPAQVDHVIDRWLPRTRALMEEMATLPASPSRYGSRLRLTGFPSSDMFGQEATAVVTNEAAGVTEARKKRTARSLPMPGVRGALARAEDFEYRARPGAFLASPHVAQQIAWLQAEVTWAVADGQPPMRVEGGTVVAPGDADATRSPWSSASRTVGAPSSSPPAARSCAATPSSSRCAWMTWWRLRTACRVTRTSSRPWPSRCPRSRQGSGSRRRRSRCLARVPTWAWWPWRSGREPSMPCESPSRARGRWRSTTWRC